MPPIRVGMIGLSAQAKTSWAGTAHLPYLRDSNGKYEITALCNSSVAAAKSAIETYNLPASTKAYGSPEDLAKDTDIDLVVCNTRVDVHSETIKPSLLRGKDVYCEWPLASNLKAAEELNSIAKGNGSRTMIGLQGQVAPIIIKLKSLVEYEARIGKILSSTVVAYGGTRTRDTVIEGLKYFTQKDVGGNMVTIGLGHMIDYVEFALGELLSFNSTLSIQRPQVPILGSDGEIVETVASNVADHIMLQGTLASSGAPLAILFRRGPPFKGDPSFTWLINGEKGEIKVTGAGAALQASDDEIRIEIHDFESDKVEVVQWARAFQDLPGQARNIAAMYEAFASGHTTKYPDFEHAVLRHRQIDELFRSSEEGRKGTYL